MSESKLPQDDAKRDREIAIRWANGESHSRLQSDYYLSHAAVFGSVRCGVKTLLAELERTSQSKDTPTPGMIAFCRSVLRDVWEHGEPNGADIQELGLKHGLLKEVTVTEACGNRCTCAEVSDFPATCYRFTEAIDERETQQAQSEGAAPICPKCQPETVTAYKFCEKHASNVPISELFGIWAEPPANAAEQALSEPKQQYVVVAEDSNEEKSLYGPFPTSDDAWRYVSRIMEHSDYDFVGAEWHAMEPPDAE